MKENKETPKMPTKDEVLAYIKASPKPFTKRELVKAFNIQGDQRGPFKKILKELLDNSALNKKPGRVFTAKTNNFVELRAVMVLKIQSISPSRILLEMAGNEKGDAPLIEIEKIPTKENLFIGQKVLVRLIKIDNKSYKATLIKTISSKKQRILAIYQGKNPGPYAIPFQGIKQDYIFLQESDLKPNPKDLILIEVMEGEGSKLNGKILKVLGAAASSENAVMMTVLARELPYEFPEEALILAKKAKNVDLEKREDLRHIPLVTIDGEDAKDFDDAVYAAEDTSPENVGGWYILVAIADVAHYVKPYDALDKEAYDRGNSIYFPGSVIPMLPHELSDDLCSLKPNVDRPCLVAHMWINKQGKLIEHKFSRALMKSVHRLTYNQVDEVLKAKNHALDDIVKPLHGAYKVLRAAREKRGALNIDSHEYKILLDTKGDVEKIQPRERLISHQMIEESMILANVAAARFLEKKKLPCLYRLHSAPTHLKKESLREFLSSTKIVTSKITLDTAADFNQILEKGKQTPFADLINDMVLRTQAQAVYGPHNIGHFGLALEKYAHFTSPIRRYSDLIVHRSILTALSEEGGLPNNLLEDSAIKTLEEMAEHISYTERRAAEAEREVVAKYMAVFMKERVGEEFSARISSIQSFGFFVHLSAYGVDGLVHVKSLGHGEYFVHDPKKHTLRGERTKKTYAMGDQVTVKLIEADLFSGKLNFELADGKNSTPLNNSMKQALAKKKTKKRRY